MALSQGLTMNTVFRRLRTSCRAAVRKPLRTTARSSSSATVCVAQPIPINSTRASCSTHSTGALPSIHNQSSRFFSRHSYHSTTHPPPPGHFVPTERAILSAAYAHIPIHGFTADTLSLGARDAGYLDLSPNVLPDGVFSLIRWHLVTQREALAAKAAGLDGVMRADAKVEALLWARLMGNEAIIGRWQDALAILAQPSYVSTSLQELAKLSDEIWFLVGDNSVDFSWYTKRASLSAVYASTELFMTSDLSEGFTGTRQFLRRRLEDVQYVGGSLRSLGQWVGYTASAGLNALRSKGMRI